MLIIRLQRVGKRNQAAFRIVVADKLRAPKKKIVENLGFYNPRTKEFAIKDETRLQYWIAQHVEMSPTTHNLLVEKGLLKAEKVKAWRPKTKAAQAAAAPAAAGGQEAAPVAESKAETSPHLSSPTSGEEVKEGANTPAT